MPKTSLKGKKPANKTRKMSSSKKNQKPKKNIKTAAPKKASGARPSEAKRQLKIAAVEKSARPKSKTSFKKEVLKKLLEARAKILQEVTQKVRSESNSLKFEIGDIYDLASTERDRELSLTLGDRDREKLSEIDEALERIKDNTYGECEECGEPIAEERLRALPFTRVCVECQSRNEKEQRIKGRVEEEPGLGILEKSETEEEEF